MTSRLLTRYLLREISLPGFGALIILTFVMLTGRMLRLLEMVINKGIPAGDILKLFLSLIPSFLIITLPLSFILGILLGFSRLSADSEIVAMRAAGFGFASLLRPVLMTAVLTSILTAWLTTSLEPRGYRTFKDQLFHIASQRATIGLHSGTFNQDFPGLTILSGTVHPKSDRLEDVFISDQRLTNQAVMIFARRGQIVSNPEQRRLLLNLDDGIIHRHQPGNNSQTYQTVKFNRYEISIDLNRQLEGNSARESNIYELSMSGLLAGAKEESDPKRRRKYLATFHERIALAVAPIILSLLAPPLGIRSHRTGRSGGFAAGLLLFLAYYLANSLAQTLVIEQGLPVFPVVWLPSLLFAAWGIHAVRKAARELPPGRPLRELFRRWQKNRTKRNGP